MADGSVPYSDHLVAYFDVLGQKEKLGRLKRLLAEEETSAEIEEIADQTYGVVERLRNDLLASNRRCYQVASAYGETFTDISEDRRTQLRKQLESKHHFSFFSDGFAVTVPYCGDNGEPLIQHVFTLLVNLSCMMIVLPSRQSVVRGAVEVGGGFEWPEGGVYGPIMADVYELESRIAYYPRIIVGVELSKRIRGWVRQVSENNPYYVEYEPLIELCGAMIGTDRDGVQILDYLCPEFLRFAGPPMTQYLRPSLDFVVAEYDRLRMAQEAQIALKYSLLTEYYSGRLTGPGQDGELGDRH